ncbi:centrosomal protein of 131 kDa-like [Macrobrachium nipponense]|uniref:centrosomal protein of 131 kDa-like n=1 Tax=Macrobrachium nipponense TaxID=159736 RepID=UPI0030C7BBF1
MPVGSIFNTGETYLLSQNATLCFMSLVLCSVPELVAIETAKHKEALRNLDLQHNSELQAHEKRSSTGGGEFYVEAELRDRLSNLDARRNEAEGEVSGLRVQISTDRTTAQAQLASVMRGMEERRSCYGRESKRCRRTLRVQIASNTSLTSANAKLNSQIHSLTNQLAELQAAVDGKALEVKAAESRVREEVKEQLEELKQEREQTAQLNSTVIKLQRTISENQLEYDSNIRKLEDKLRHAKQEVKQREEELLKIREDEERRVGMLHSAFVSYFNTSPSSPTKANQMK